MYSMKHTPFRAAVCVLFLSCLSVSAEAQFNSIPVKETKALSKVSSELVKLARTCAKNKVYEEARAELRKALIIAPKDAKPVKELKKLEGKSDKPGKYSREKIEKERGRSYKKCAKILMDFALQSDKGGHADSFERCVTLVRTYFPESADLSRFELVYFEPYHRWIRKEDAARLEAGGERVDGEWLEAEAVQKLNEKHRSWSKPWSLSDEFHEIRTTMPLRTARQVFAHVAAYRAFFLAHFAGRWNLGRPDGKLKVIVTETQDELREQMRSAARGSNLEFRGAAYYLWTNMALNPCFVTFEPNTASGRSAKVDFARLAYGLRHELTHQLAFECCKQESNRLRSPEYHYWAVEGLATYMQYHELDEDGWRLRHRSKISFEGAYMEAAFAYCVDNLESLPRLKEFVNVSRTQFATMVNYHVSATLAHFLLNGAEGRYEKSFIALLDEVHKANEEPGSFEKCFKGVDIDELQEEWEGFVRELKIESAAGGGPDR